MRITYIKLVKYKRFPLRESDVFEHTFTEKMTLILGPNGSGKSSLMSELTPLPPLKENFHKGGFKDIKIEHEGKVYQLLADFTDGVKYFFYAGEENLNPSGLLSIQRELVAQHFSISPALHDIFTGAENFTDIGLVARKKLFQTVTHLNIDAILSSHEEIKSRLKAQEYVRKTVTSQLLSEQTKANDTDRSAALQERQSQLQEGIEMLLSTRAGLMRYCGDQQATDAQQRLHEALSRLSNLRMNAGVAMHSTPQSTVREEITQATAKVQVARHHLQSLYSRLEQCEQERRALELSQGLGVSQIKEALQSKERLQESLLSSLTLFKDQNASVPAISQALAQLETALPELIELLPVNSDKALGKAALARCIEEKAACWQAMQEITKRDAQAQATLKELFVHEQLQCPNCNHTWEPGEIASRRSQAQAVAQECTKEGASITTRLAALEKEEARQQEYLQGLTGVLQHYTSTKETLLPMWKEVLQLNLLYDNPQGVLQMLRQAAVDLLRLQELQACNQEIVILKEQLNAATLASHLSAEQLKANTLATEAEIAHQQRSLAEKEQLIQDLRLTEQLHERQSKIAQMLSATHTELQAANLTHTVKAVVSEIDKELSVAKVGLLETSKEIHTQSVVQASVARLQEQLSTCEDSVHVLSAMVQELSPKNGLIAETVSQFLNTIIGRINALIASVWNYRMQLKVLDMEEDSLTYRFKVIVRDSLVIDDISKVSGGMKEIINLSLKVTLFQLLKLQGYPIYFDELGVKLDQHHRAKIADIVFKTIANPNYSQIFLITHMDMAYSAFKDTEVLEF